MSPESRTNEIETQFSGQNAAKGSMWFVYDPEGFGYEEFKTHAEAKKRMEETLKEYVAIAKGEGAWDDYWDQVRMGQVTARGRVVEAEPETYDGVIESV
jgi:hypothetical protein